MRVAAQLYVGNLSRSMPDDTVKAALEQATLDKLVTFVRPNPHTFCFVAFGNAATAENLLAENPRIEVDGRRLVINSTRGNPKEHKKSVVVVKTPSPPAPSAAAEKPAVAPSVVIQRPSGEPLAIHRLIASLPVEPPMPVVAAAPARRPQSVEVVVPVNSTALYCEMCSLRCATLTEMGIHLSGEEHKKLLRQVRAEEEKAQALLARQRLEAMESYKASVRAKAKAVLAETPVVNVGDARELPCVKCGKNNLPRFKWCSFCGASSTSASAVAPGVAASVVAPVLPPPPHVDAAQRPPAPAPASVPVAAAPTQVRAQGHATMSSGPLSLRDLLEKAALLEYWSAFQAEGITELSQVRSSRVFAAMKPFHQRKLDNRLALL